MIPGWTIATRTLKGLTSWASPSLNASSANFEAARRQRRARNPPGHGRDVDDAAIPSCSHVWQPRSNRANGAKVVGFHRGLEVVERQSLDRPSALDAGIVHQRVDRARLGTDGGCCRVHGFIRIDVHRQDRDGQAFLFDNRTKRNAAFKVPHGRIDRMTGPAHYDRRLEADTRARSGH